MNVIKIDFVSDIACPWCAVGLAALEQAIANVKDEVKVELHFQPFELNPKMPPEGQDIIEHLTEKYRMTAEQVAQNQDHIRQRGAELGFHFNMDGRKRTYNTFDAHRLLHWAESEEQGSRQHALKRALLEAYFTEGQDPSSHEVLLDAAEKVGLDRTRAAAILVSDTYSGAVREREQLYLSQGIHSVPSVIFNEKHLIQGGQPVETFEQALLQLAGVQ
jgi:predicted DsbA family dithiol-disulfide isomerase